MNSKITELAQKYRPLAIEILKEVVRIPADHVDQDPSCGMSNHEGPRLEYLLQKIIEVGAVEKPEDVQIDGFGNLVWTVQDHEDGVAPEDKAVIYFDGHSDTVAPLRHRWEEAIGGGIDCYNGMVDPEKVNVEFLQSELGWLPPQEEWEHLVWGRGSADQLAGVVSQVISTKILLELKSEGALKGAIIRSYATACEEDNDGAGPMYIKREVLPGAGPEFVPDVVILSEGTGDARKGGVGIYRGQRGRMQIEVQVTGKSCHGSMPWEGRNPLEFAAYIITEATEQIQRGEGIADDDFLGSGTRTASFATLETPSDCAVPERFTFRFDRRLTAGEDPEDAIARIEGLPAVAKAREAGLHVEVRAPVYGEASWKGYVLNNAQIYPGWVTPEDHPAIRAARAAYEGCASPVIPEGGVKGQLRKAPRVDRWIFSTDGVGFPLRCDDSSVSIPESKNWIVKGAYRHPAMFGIGPGQEQNTHKIGEYMDSREFDVAIATMARFPSLYVEMRRGEGGEE
jgi:putative selenium metabolism hydrolase